MVLDREGKDDSYAAPRLNLSVSDYEFIRVLGEGSMSSVFHAVLKRTVGDHAMLQGGAACALKVVDKFYVQRHKMTDSVVRERHIMDKLQTTFTIRLQYTFQDSQKIYMALDLYECGDLFEQLQLRKPLPIDEARFYAAEIVLIMQCLREHSVVFRDLKPENLLLDSSGHLVLTDFGCAKLLTPSVSEPAGGAKGASACSNERTSIPNTSETAAETRAVTFVGTADYLSPEVLKNEGCTLSIDLWSFGCVLFQLFAGVPPFRDSTSYLIMQRIDEMRYTFPEGFPEDAKDLVSQLLREDPWARIGADDLEQLKAHAFFQGVDWDTLRASKAPGFKKIEFKTEDADLWEMRAMQAALPAVLS